MSIISPYDQGYQPPIPDEWYEVGRGTANTDGFVLTKVTVMNDNACCVVAGYFGNTDLVSASVNAVVSADNPIN